MSLGLLKIWQLVSILKNRLQARTAANFKLRITLLAAFSLLNVVLGGMLYKWTSAEDSWSAALFQVYAVLYSIPGADITHAPTKGGTVVLNCIFIFGLLVFATILAMITEEVNTFLLAARSGRAPLVMSGHILILNWNEQVPFLLDQFEAVQHSVSGAGGGAHKLSGRPLVILADKDKEDMDALVVGFMRKHKLEVHTRSGKPYKLEHLERVSASAAAAVLVLHPEAAASTCATATAAADTAAAEGCGGSSVQGSGAGGATGCTGSSSGGMSVRPGADDGAAALKLQTVMAVTAQLMGGRKAAVVVQVPESDSCTAGGRRSCQWEMLDNVLARSGHDMGLMELPVKRMVNSLAVQAALQPWSASIYTQLMQHGRQPDLTFHQLPQSLLFTKQSRSFKPLGLSRSSGSSSSSRQTSAASADYGLTSSFSLRSSSTVFKRPGGTLAAGQASRAGLKPSMSHNPGLFSAATATAAAAAAVPEGAMLYDDVRVRYEGRGSIVLGYYRVSDQELVLNPVKGSWCEPGDVLVALTRNTGRTTSVFARLWQPLLSSISSSSAIQQQLLQQQSAAKPVAATAAVAAVAGTTAAAAAAASSSQHNPPNAGRANQQEQPSLTEQQQEQASKQPGLRHSRPSLAPIAEITDDAGQQQQQSQQLSSTSQTQPNPQDSTAHQQQEVTGQGTHQQQQHTQQAAEQCFASQLVDDDASHFASPFAAATASTAAVHEDCMVCESEPLLTTTSPAADPCSSAGDSGHHLDAHHSQPTGLGEPCVSVSGPPGLRSAPSWLFSAHKVLQQQDQQLATQRLSRMKGSLGGSGMSSNERTRSRHDWGDQERYVVVAGFTAAECGRDLLPHFLDFAPADSRVVFAVGPFEEPPPELDYEGTVEEEEDRQGMTPILHRVHYRFIQVAYPTSAEGLQAAGVLEADALLLGPEEGVRDSSSAEADAQVLGSIVELQHLLSHSDRYQRTHSGPFRPLSGSSKPSERKSSWGRKRTSFKHTTSRSNSSHEGSLSGTAVEAAAAAALAAAPNNITAAGGAAEGTADDRDVSASTQAGSLGVSQLSAQAVQQHRTGLQQPWPNMAQHPGDQQQSPLHVVACVTTTASKAVAAAFFGAMGPDAAASAVSSKGLRQGSGSVVGACEFTYELIVPGEVESAVLVQVAGEPLYTRVIHELLGTSEGCELYLLPPGAFGCNGGEVLRFAELQAVGHLVNRTVIGVVAGGRVILAPGREWRWHVQGSDKVAVLALSWEC